MSIFYQKLYSHKQINEVKDSVLNNYHKNLPKLTEKRKFRNE